MPNTPVFVGEVASAIALGNKATKEDSNLVSTLFNSVGYCAPVPENLINAVTGVSGSGPAYVFIMIEALADGGVRAGLPRDIAQKLAAQTVLGSAKMVLDSGKHPGQLKDMVTSPAGKPSQPSLCCASGCSVVPYVKAQVVASVQQPEDCCPGLFCFAQFFAVQPHVAQPPAARYTVASDSNSLAHESHGFTCAADVQSCTQATYKQYNYIRLYMTRATWVQCHTVCSHAELH